MSLKSARALRFSKLNDSMFLNKYLPHLLNVFVDSTVYIRWLEFDLGYRSGDGSCLNSGSTEATAGTE